MQQQDTKIRIDLSPPPSKKSPAKKRGRPAGGARKTPEAKEEAKQEIVCDDADNFKQDMYSIYSSRFEMYRKGYQLYYGPKNPQEVNIK